MKISGLELTDGADIVNLAVDSGTDFPTHSIEGALFYRCDTDLRIKGLYAFISSSWERLGSAEATTVPVGAVLPGTGNIGDIFYKNSDDAAEGLYVFNGADWISVAIGGAAPPLVSSVNAQQGDVVLTTSHIIEDLNLYWTATRFDTAFTGKSTTNLAEGSNLYFTTTRARSTLSAGAGAGYNSGTGVISANVISVVGRSGAVVLSTTDVGEGANLYWTSVRFDTAFTGKSTTNLAEGSNLYFTSARASAAAPVQSVAGRTGVVSITSTDVGLSSLTTNQPANTFFGAPSSGSGVPGFRILTAGDIPAHNTTWASITSTPTTLFGYGVTDANPAFSGDVTKALNGTVLTLANSGVSIGTYTKVTVDAKGRVTIGANPSTLDGYGITDAVPSAYLAVSNGVATLDATGHLSNEQIPTSLIGSVYKGTWNATTNTPTLASGVGTKGDFYIISTGGSTAIDGTSSWLVGDQIIFSGSVWQRIAGAPSAVSSVAGRTGAVVLAVADVSGAAVNSAVVHNTGAETLAGVKTFSSTIIGSISGNAATVTTNANLTGDVTSVGNATTLPAVGTAGTYRSVTTDAKGRITGGTNPTTLVGYGITDASPAYTGDVLKAANSNILDLLPIGTPGTYQVVTTDDNGRVIAGSNPTTLSGFGITDGSPAFTGDVTKALNGTVLTLSASGVSASTYKSVTVDVKGRVTAGTNPTTLTGYGITDAVATGLLGAVSGVATLDISGKVPTAQLPGVAIDNAVLHLAGTETVTGTKTFSALITGSISGNATTVTTNANLTGDVTSAGNATTLSLTGIGAGTYRSVTVDTKGRVTAGSNPTTIVGYGITDANPAFTGDVTKALNGIVLTLSSTGVGAGTYRSVTVDTKGRVTAGSNPTTIVGYGITDAVSSALLGATSGIATLDNAGKVLLAQLPSLGASVYKGTWNASTNTPSIADGVGSAGDYYAIDTPGGTFIDGTDSWIVGDQIIFNGTIWQKIPGTPSAVATVAGRTGNITLTVSDITGAAVDNAVLHLAGTETITGAKTFSALVTGSISGNASTVTTNANLTGDVTSVGNVTTLSTSGIGAGTYRSVTVDTKGRVTAGTNPTTLVGYGITDANPAFTGDVTKALNGTTLTLAGSGASAGTYRSVTVDTKGRVTAGSNPTTIVGYGITDVVSSAVVGVASGIATLDSGGTLTAAQVPTALVGASVYKGSWNATTNTPVISSGVGVKGNYYSIGSPGSTNIDGNATWLIGDRLIFTGSAWERMSGTVPVITSVAGKTDAVTLVKADITDLITRTITGTTNQITVSNGDGAAGDPVLSLSSNPVVPGVSSITLPVGSTVQRPGAPTLGMLRFNSSLVKYEGYDGGWKNLAAETFVAANYQPLDADLTAIAAMVSTGITVNAGAGTWAARTLIAPASGLTITNPDGVNGNPTFALAGELAAIEALSTNGLLARTGSFTWAPRALTGTANQITVTNADGVAGDPIISLANNPIIPGYGSVTIPIGTTAQRSVGSVSGAMRYNSTLDKYEFYQGGQWTTALNGVAPGVVPSQMTQLLTGQVPAITGTNIMPFDNNVPTSTNGLFLFSRSITTSAAGARVMFSFPYWLDTSTNATIIMQIFRNPFMGYQIINVGANKTTASATNYVSGTTYNATITIDGVAKPISLLGSNMTTYATLINGINNALGNAGAAVLAGGNVKIISATSSTSSSVTIANGSPALFASPLNGFVSILTAVQGSTPGALISVPNTITAKGTSSSVAIVDTPGLGTFTYTVRVGTNTGTFYINQNAAGNNFGGFNTTSYFIMEVV